MTVIQPENQFDDAIKKIRAKSRKYRKISRGFGEGAFYVMVAGIIACGFFNAPVLALGILGGVVACCAAISFGFAPGDTERDISWMKYERNKKITEAAAKAEFDRVLEKFDMQEGMEFPLAVPEPLKILRIDQVETNKSFKDGGFVPVTTVTAQMYDAHMGANGLLVRDPYPLLMPPLKRTILAAGITPT